MLKDPNRLGHYITEQPVQPQEQPAQPPHTADPSWVDTGAMPALQPGLATWEQMQQWDQVQQKAKKEPTTPAPRNWQDELPKPRYQQNLPVFRETFDFDKFSARVMKITVLIFAYLFLLLCLTSALIRFAFMK